jgi:hypothetical protein
MAPNDSLDDSSSAASGPRKDAASFIGVIHTRDPITEPPR